MSTGIFARKGPGRGGGGGGGGGGHGDDDVVESLKIHALLCSIGFLVLLPIGALTARYLRTFTGRWFWAHALIQFIIAGPVILAGWAYGYMSTAKLETGGNWHDRHKRIGLALLILYLGQVSGGLIIHYFKTPKLFHGRRPPQNYFHAILGLTIIALAFYQVHYGLTVEWFEAVDDDATIPSSAVHAWEALIVIFWVMYALGLLLLRRQYTQEATYRKTKQVTTI